MQILVVAGFAVVMTLTAADGENPSVPSWALVAAACAYVLGAYAAARWLVARALTRTNPSSQSSRPAGWTSALLAHGGGVYLVGGLVGLMLAGWGCLVARIPYLGRAPLLGKLLDLGPFVLGLLAYWWAMYPLERAARTRRAQYLTAAGMTVPAMWSRKQYLLFNVRHHLLFVAAPAGTIILLLDLITLLDGVVPEAVVAAAGLTCAGAVFLAAPTMIVHVWATRPLANGPLRGRLENACRRLGLRFRQILVWETGGGIVNAAVLGLVRPFRYVLLSDALLADFDAEEVEAIFAHEAGHVIHRHIQHMAAFTGGVLLLAGWAGYSLAGVFAVGGQWVDLSVLLGVAVVWLWGFGVVSRRFERQSDVFAAWVAGGAGDDGRLTPEGVSLFGNALLSVGRLNGIASNQPNFRHGSLADRVQYLADLLRSGQGRREVDRRTRLVKLTAWALLAAGLAVNLAMP